MATPIEQFDAEILELIPHRPPMLLINRLVTVTKEESQALVEINQDSPFYQPSHGVPAWIGLEYMGQTAALIAGYQLREGLTQPHLGLLLGSRNYATNQEYFSANTQLLVSCQQAAMVGESLVTFNCTISDHQSQQQLATANLSVFRKPLN